MSDEPRHGDELGGLPPPSVPPPPSSGNDGGTGKKPWWQRWWVIATGVLVLFAAVGSLGEETNDPAAASSPSPSPEVEVSSEPDPEPEPTEEPTTEEPEPEPESEEPEAQPADRATQILVFGSVFEENRLGVIDEIESAAMVESVDAFNFDPDSEQISIAATSYFSTADYIDDEAWELARYLGGLWSPSIWEGVDRDPEWWPTLRMEVSGRVWDCPVEAMTGLADRRLSRAEWFAACGR